LWVVVNALNVAVFSIKEVIRKEFSLLIQKGEEQSIKISEMNNNR
jgi:hypothetical protein